MTHVDDICNFQTTLNVNENELLRCSRDGLISVTKRR